MTVHPKSATDSPLRLFETDQIRLGTLDPGVLPVLVSKRGHRHAQGHGSPVLGLDLLSQFKVRIDIDRGRLWLKHASPGPVSFAGIPDRELHHITPGPQKPVRFGSRPRHSSQRMPRRRLLRRSMRTLPS